MPFLRPNLDSYRMQYQSPNEVLHTQYWVTYDEPVDSTDFASSSVPSHRLVPSSRLVPRKPSPVSEGVYVRFNKRQSVAYSGSSVRLMPLTGL